MRVRQTRSLAPSIYFTKLKRDGNNSVFDYIQNPPIVYVMAEN